MLSWRLASCCCFCCLLVLLRYLLQEDLSAAHAATSNAQQMQQQVQEQADTIATLQVSRTWRQPAIKWALQHCLWQPPDPTVMLA